MKEIIRTGYEPRPLQHELHLALKRFNVLVCHRRFGKTVFGINEMIDKATRSNLKNPRYAYVAPLYSQAKRVAWDYFNEYTSGLPGKTKNEQELRIDLPDVNGSRIMLLGADNPSSIKGIYLDGVILDEFAEMDPATWSEVIRPMLIDRQGWAIFIGTPKGDNHFKKIYDLAENDPEWFRALYDGEETGIIPPHELERLKLEMDPAEYNQEIKCSFEAALVGAYYVVQFDKLNAEKRICDVKYDSSAPVHTAWDLGVGDAMAVWCYQQVGPNVQCIKYLEYTGVGMDHVAKDLAEQPYIYGDHVLPWDANHRDVSTGKKRVDKIRGLLPGNIRVLERSGVDDGISEVRRVLDKTWFDKVECADGTKALRHYRKKWDAKSQCFGRSPIHDWASHGADAFRTLSMGLRDDRIDRKSLPRKAITEYDIFGF